MALVPRELQLAVWLAALTAVLLLAVDGWSEGPVLADSWSVGPAVGSGVWGPAVGSGAWQPSASDRGEPLSVRHPPGLDDGAGAGDDVASTGREKLQLHDAAEQRKGKAELSANTAALSEPAPAPAPAEAAAAALENVGVESIAAAMSALEDVFGRFNFTKPGRVTELAFPLETTTHSPPSCRHHRLHPILNAWLRAPERRALNISIIGGSPSARGLSCGMDSDPATKYHTDMFAPSLAADVAEVQRGGVRISNAAQGATDSVYGSFMLDSLIDTDASDIIIWEYAVNDASGVAYGTGRALQASNSTMRSRLELFLMRYSLLPEPRPALVLLYLWDSKGTLQCDETRFPRSTAWQASQQTVARWQKRGLDISVILAGETIVSCAVGAAEALDSDGVHPNCASSALLAALLRHFLLRQAHFVLQQEGEAVVAAAARCGFDTSPLPPDYLETTVNPDPAAGPMRLMLRAASDPANLGTVGSMMKWEPQHGRPGINVTQGAEGAASAMLLGTKTKAGREDRKIEYVLPACFAGALHFYINEPGLIGIGMGWGGGIQLMHRYGGTVVVKIDGVEHSGNLGDEAMRSWERIDTAQQYRFWYAMPARRSTSGSASATATTVVEICKNSTRASICPTPKLPDQCLAWNRAYAKAHPDDQSVGKFGMGEPQLNWIVGIVGG